MRLLTPTSPGGTPVSTEVPSLAQALSLIPDFRQAQGRRFELLPVLLLACVAVLCGCRSQAAISQWGFNYGPIWLRKLGFSSDRAPSQPTLHRILKGINHLLVEQALTTWSQKVLARLAPASSTELEPVAIDGKTLCGSSKQGARCSLAQLPFSSSGHSPSSNRRFR
jgi:DDE_Tnp_1-associated